MLTSCVLGAASIGEMHNQPRIGVRATRILILTTFFISTVFGYFSLLLILWIYHIRRDQRLLSASQWRQKIHMNDAIAPEYPHDFVATVTLGRELISPRITHKVEDLLRNFEEVLKLRMDLEEFNREE